MSMHVDAGLLVRAFRNGSLTPFRFVMAYQRAGFTAGDAWRVVERAGR